MARNGRVDITNVLICLAEGQSVQDIANSHGVSYNYMASQLQHVRHEWGCANNVQLMAEAYHRGVLVPRTKAEAA